MIFSELQKRFFTSLILLPITVFAILFDKKIFIFFLIIIFILSIYEWIKLNKNIFSFYNIIGCAIILLSVFSAYFLRGNNLENKIIFLWIIFVCFFSDIGGYFFGKMIGGKKITKISPNKTYSGMMGSLIFSILPIFILYFFTNYFSTLIILVLSWKIIFLSIILSLFCQLGDITISYFKRKSNVKDTGRLLPGHGGLLDRIDGLILAMIFAGILKIFEII